MRKLRSVKKDPAPITNTNPYTYYLWLIFIGTVIGMIVGKILPFLIN